MRADHKKIKRKLNIAKGQIEGIINMIDEDRYCLDISHQLLSVDAVVRRANKEVLREHLMACMRDAVEQGDVSKIEELTDFFDKTYS